MSAGGLARLLGLADVDLPGLIASLTRLRLTVACAESLTGGLLAALLTEVPGASAVFRGSLVVYATDLKHSLAGVDAALLAERGPVDPDVAIALARGAAAACAARLGLGLTGVAGPDPQHGIAVGTFYVAIADGDSVVLTENSPADGQVTEPAASRREQIRAAAVRAAVELLTDRIQGR